LTIKTPGDRQVADAPRESYIDGIWNKDSEEEWLTEIQIPISMDV
jgi:hypothetical protein